MPRYELNIARLMDGQGLYFHYAKVVLGATDEQAARAQATLFAMHFGEPDWKLTLTCWKEEGRDILI